jgi:hypothetical protein
MPTVIFSETSWLAGDADLLFLKKEGRKDIFFSEKRVAVKKTINVLYKGGFIVGL